MFKKDGTLLSMTGPSLVASIGNNTFLVKGDAETKVISDLVPDIIPQVGVEGLQYVQSYLQATGKKDEDADLGFEGNFDDVADQAESDEVNKSPNEDININEEAPELVE